MAEETSSEKAQSAKAIKLMELTRTAEADRPALGAQLDLIRGVKVNLVVSVGRCEVTVAELFALKDGAVLKLDRPTEEPVEIYLDNKLIGRGELVVVDDNFAVRITELGRTSTP